MKRIAYLALFGLALAPAAAHAETIWGTVTSYSPNSSLSLKVENSEVKNAPSTLTVPINQDVKVKGDLQSGAKVKANVNENDGAWVAKSVEVVDSIPAGQAKSASTDATSADINTATDASASANAPAASETASAGVR